MNLTDRPIYQKTPKEAKTRKPMRQFSEKRAKQRASREGKRGQEYMRQVKQCPAASVASRGHRTRITYFTTDTAITRQATSTRSRFARSITKTAQKPFTTASKRGAKSTVQTMAIFKAQDYVLTRAIGPRYCERVGTECMHLHSSFCS